MYEHNVECFEKLGLNYFYSKLFILINFLFTYY